MLESLERDVEASCVAEELRILAIGGQTQRVPARLHTAVRDAPLGYLCGSRNLVLFEQPRLTHNLPDGDERYGIRFNMVDYLIVRSFLINLLVP